MRVKNRWGGFSGAPGFTVLHYSDFASGGGGGGPVTAENAQNAANRASSLFNAIKTLVPVGVTMTIEPDVDVIEDTTGELVTSFPAAGSLSFTGTGTGPFSAATGAVINWRTTGVRKGRRVRGRSFIVPLSSGAFGTDGQLLPASQTLLQQQATAAVLTTGTPDLGVYARPSSAGATDGAFFVASSASVPRLGAVLRSRRD